MRAGLRVSDTWHSTTVWVLYSHYRAFMTSDGFDMTIIVSGQLVLLLSCRPVRTHIILLSRSTTLVVATWLQ
jgi:hypothetical protein